MEERIVTLTTEITNKENTPTIDQSELMTALNRLQDMKGLLNQWLSRMNTLLRVWETLLQKLEDFFNWLEGLEKELKTPMNLKTPIVEILEQQMDDLKVRKKIHPHHNVCLC